jgi:cell division protein FtsB|tara:strand:+ start:307 stop:510 length:204 start_codon:yes stop_codon:yes gene_type:complete
MNAQIVISRLQRKVSELTLINVMLEAQVEDLQTQLNTINEQTSDAQVDGNENQAKEIDDSSSSPDDF